jgi:hypothetical protein
MFMKEFVAIAVSAINLFIAASYFWLMLKKRSKPALAMWLFFSLAVAMSLVTYLKEGNYGFWDNALNTTDLFLVVFVTICILIFGDKSTRFNRFDTWCLVAVVLIILFWVISQNHLLTNLGIQLILVIAYFPVVRRMLKTNENTEPFIVWIALMIAPVISLITSKGALAAIYAIRAIACTGLLLALMVRIEVKNKKIRAIEVNVPVDNKQ